MRRNRRDIVLQLLCHEQNSADIGFVFYKGGGGKHLSHSFHNTETLHLSHHGISLIRAELFDLEKRVDLMKFSCAHRVFQIEDIWWSTLQKCHCIVNYTSYATWNQTGSSSQVWYVYILSCLRHKYQECSDFPWKFLFGVLLLFSSFFFSNDYIFEHGTCKI